jgi:hypothetical protein
MLQTVFAKRNIKWPRTNNTYEMFVSAFQQLQTQLEELDLKEVSKTQAAFD